MQFWSLWVGAPVVHMFVAIYIVMTQFGQKLVYIRSGVTGVARGLGQAR